MGFKLKGNDSLGFFNLNRNKRSFALNLKARRRDRYSTAWSRPPTS
jgi:crotonobetainyl-CoA:carnitine CoA-transferase CaiB-like acyl-CoA transferase